MSSENARVLAALGRWANIAGLSMIFASILMLSFERQTVGLIGLAIVVVGALLAGIAAFIAKKSEVDING